MTNMMDDDQIKPAAREELYEIAVLLHNSTVKLGNHEYPLTVLRKENKL